MFLRQFIALLFTFFLLQKESRCQESGWGLSAAIEYKTYVDDLGYGIDIEKINTKWGFGLGYLFSSSSDESLRSVSHITQYFFYNHSIHLPVFYRFGNRKQFEIGMQYSFMRSKVDYLDYYPASYKFYYKGTFDQHFAGLILAWRYIHFNGFFLRPSFRLGFRFASAEHPVEKTIILYNQNQNEPTISGQVFSYSTFKMSIGYLIPSGEGNMRSKAIE